MQVVLERAGRAQCSVLENLFQLYMHDMSAWFSISMTETGRFRFDPASLDAYWEDAAHHAFLIRADGELAGFLLVQPCAADPGCRDVEQFFVLRRFRRSGVGADAFRQCLQALPGRWQVRVLPENQPAYAFWQGVVDGVSAQGFTQRIEHEDGLDMCFLRFQTGI